jgi:3-hydroxyisobutyrate dehydrogenase-like beta-hydroxyacid dehydrogenase
MSDPSGPIAEPPASMAGSVIKSIGVVGLGHMGHAFATNLVEDGYQVLVHDRDPQRIADSQATGAQLSDLAGCDAVLTSLPDDDALAAVALAPDGLARVLAANAVHISTSTVSLGLSGQLAEEHASRGQEYVACPVLGNPDFVHCWSASASGCSLSATTLL